MSVTHTIFDAGMFDDGIMDKGIIISASGGTGDEAADETHPEGILIYTRSVEGSPDSIIIHSTTGSLADGAADLTADGTITYRTTVGPLVDGIISHVADGSLADGAAEAPPEGIIIYGTAARPRPTASSSRCGPVETGESFSSVSVGWRPCPTFRHRQHSRYVLPRLRRSRHLVTMLRSSAPVARSCWSVLSAAPEEVRRNAGVNVG